CFRARYRRRRASVQSAGIQRAGLSSNIVGTGLRLPELRLLTLRLKSRRLARDFLIARLLFGARLRLLLSQRPHLLIKPLSGLGVGDGAILAGVITLEPILQRRI